MIIHQNWFSMLTSYVDIHSSYVELVVSETRLQQMWIFCKSLTEIPT